jgi:hypothetical protein
MWDDRDTRVEELVGLAAGDNAVARDPSGEGTVKRRPGRRYSANPKMLT